MYTHNRCKGGKASCGKFRAFVGSSVWRKRQGVLLNNRFPALIVQAKSSDRSGDSGSPDDWETADLSFERDVAHSVCKVMTAKAVQHVLAQLGETDLIVCQWLNNFAADHSPLKGDDFILELMAQKPSSVINRSSGTKHEVNPQQLGNRVILMREQLSKSVSKMVPGEIQKRNVTVLRKHLEATSYISGTSDETGRSSPGYRRGVEGTSRGRFR